MFSTYYTQQTPAIMREVNARYDVDALYANGWPNWNMPVCYCDVCRKLPAPGTREHHEIFMQRAIEIWKLYDGIAKEKRPDNVFFGNLGGGMRTGLDLMRLSQHCDWFNADNQGRTGASPAWGASQQGRVAQCVMKGRTITNVTGAWSTGSPMWRNATKSPAEAEHVDGADRGQRHGHLVSLAGSTDRAWEKTAAGRTLADAFCSGTHAITRHFINRGSIANIGVVLGTAHAELLSDSR
jgi:hypothetical protein